PPISTLFPYTTLFRSEAHARHAPLSAVAVGFLAAGTVSTARRDSQTQTGWRRFSALTCAAGPGLRKNPAACPGRGFQRGHAARRSEEHTSELQSLAYL